MKILLTGATGFVGTNFVLTLHKKYEIIALVRQSSDVSKIDKFCKIYRYDESIESIQRVFENEKIDGVVHTASLVLGGKNEYSSLKELIKANIEFPSLLLEAICQKPVKFFINTSSSFEYANSNEYKPTNFYAATKRAFYSIMKHYYSFVCNDTIFVSLLFYNAYGQNDRRGSVFDLWIKLLKEQNSLKMSAGEQKVDYTHIKDMVRAYDTLIELCMQNKAINNQIYTVENKRYSLKELASLFEKISGKKLSIKWGAKPYRENEIFNPISAKDSKELKKLPNYKPKISLEEGIKMLINDNISSNGGGALTFLENNLLSLQNSLNNTLEVA